MLKMPSQKGTVLTEGTPFTRVSIEGIPITRVGKLASVRRMLIEDEIVDRG